jgi:hypothetical protein
MTCACRSKKCRTAFFFCVCICIKDTKVVCVVVLMVGGDEREFIRSMWLRALGVDSVCLGEVSLVLSAYGVAFSHCDAGKCTRTPSCPGRSHRSWGS